MEVGRLADVVLRLSLLQDADDLALDEPRPMRATTATAL
jgi:hypothetical protein